MEVVKELSSEPWFQILTEFYVSAQVSPIIINTVITIQSALTPAAETPEELESPVPVDLWEKRSWKDLKLWFLEENGDEDAASLAPLIPQGESLQVLFCVVTQAIMWHAIITCQSWFYLQECLTLCSGSFCWLSVSAGQHQIYLCDSGGWSWTPHHSNAAGQVLLPWRCGKLVHTH